MEAEFLAWLRGRLPPHPRLLLGPGDDAAILELSRRDGCVITTDLLTDGVDFILDPSQATIARIGRKALAVNLSDLAAMAARPVAAVIALALPRTGALELARQLYAGLLPLAEEFETAIAGGDTNTWDGPLVISVTAIGETTERGPLLRRGARPGDAILVTGELGGSILGKQFDFVPRVREALAWHARFELHAGTDISDGLLKDLAHVAEESGCAAELDLDAIPVSQAAERLTAQQADGRSALDHALADGEDFELILATPPATAEEMLAATNLGIRLTRIGRFVAGEGLWSAGTDGGCARLAPRGYEH